MTSRRIQPFDARFRLDLDLEKVVHADLRQPELRVIELAERTVAPEFVQSRRGCAMPGVAP
jgi:hypothetical protein